MIQFATFSIVLFQVIIQVVQENALIVRALAI
jgi:hypothetical protein